MEFVCDLKTYTMRHQLCYAVTLRFIKSMYKLKAISHNIKQNNAFYYVTAM